MPRQRKDRDAGKPSSSLVKGRTGAVSRAEAARRANQSARARARQFDVSKLVAPPEAPLASLGVWADRTGRPTKRVGPSFMRMLLDPFDRDAAVRYPDDTIAPTALVHLASTMSYETTDSTFLAGLSVKNVDLGPSTANYATPIVIPGANNGPSYSRLADYGAQQQAWRSLDSIDRTLACGMRVKLVGLPNATFVPSGTLYFLQLQANEARNALATALTETTCIQAVNAGKGYSITSMDLMSVGGITIPYVPQGSISFDFSDSNALADHASIYNTALSQVQSAKPFLVVVGFGMSVGMVLRVDYAHHIEYVPTPQAAGLVATRSQPPSVAARESISSFASQIVEELFGSTNAKEISAIVGDIASIAGGLLGSVVGGPAGGAIGAGAGKLLTM